VCFGAWSEFAELYLSWEMLGKRRVKHLGENVAMNAPQKKEEEKKAF